MEAKVLAIGALIVLAAAAVLIFSMPNTGQATAAQAQEPIKIGFIGSLTGGSAIDGTEQLNSLQLAVDEINQAGGIDGRQIKLIAEDGKCDAKEAVTAANELLNVQEARIILTECSSESLAVAPLANSKKVLQLAILTSSKDYTNAGDYSFRTTPSTDKYVKMLGEQAAAKYGAKNVAILAEQKDFPKSAAVSFKAGLEENGGSIAIEEYFQPNETDFKTQLEKISQSKADSIFFASQSQATAAIWLKAMKEKGMLGGKYRLFSGAETVTKGVFEATQGLNKSIITTDLHTDAANPKAKEFLNDYKDKYGSYPETTLAWNTTAYDGVNFIGNAIQACGKEDTDCMKEYFYKNSLIDGASGKMSFDKYGDAIVEVSLHYFDMNGKEQWINIGTTAD